MTTQTTPTPESVKALADLADRVESATGPGRELDAAIAAVFRLEKVPDWARTWTGEWRPTDQGSVVMMHSDGMPGPHFMAREYTASLDAAMTLVPPGWGWSVHQPNEKAIASGLLKRDTPVMGEVQYGCDHRLAVAAATPALALCCAALRARAHIGASHG